MGSREWCLGLALIATQCALGCGGRVLEGPGGDEQEAAGWLSYGAEPSYAGSSPNGAGAFPSKGGAPNYTPGSPAYGGAPNHGAGAPNYTAGGPNYAAGGPNYTAGGPNDAGAPNYAAGAPNTGGAPPAHGGAPPTDQPWEVQQLARIRAGIVGTWVGTQMNVWTAPCPVQITFTSDGYYSDHSPGESCSPFYWDSSDDTPEKTYLIDDVTAAAEGVGSLALYWSPGDTNEAQMKRIALNADNSALTFSLYYGDAAPLSLALTRLP